MKKKTIIVMVIGFVFGLSPIALGALTLISQSATVNPASGEVLFTAKFDVPPVFPYQLQYLLNFDSEIPIQGASNTDAVLRVFLHNEMGVPILQGYFGSLLGYASYNTFEDGTKIQVGTTLATLGEADGLFSYRLDAYQSGSDLWSVYGNSTIVPEPASMTILALGGLALLRRRK
ncbi:MAG: PEP-CTERM sorting domain-containing protein [Sedimentisphaerales bacterium]|jgi:hypothetical protein